MIIELTTGINWDTEIDSNKQSIEAHTWISENIKSKRAFSKDNTENIQPEWDDYGRPKQWIITDNNIEFTVIWNYQKQESTEWAKLEDTITIKTL